MKTIKMPVSAKEFKKLADVKLVEGDVTAALHYLSSAIKDPTLTQKALNQYKKDYSRALSMRCKYGYANEVLFNVLYDNPKDKEALSLVMYNYQALGLKDQAQYYYDKCKDYLNKKKKSFMNFLSKTPNDTLLIDGEEYPIEEITEEAVDEFLGGDLLKEIKQEKEKSIFTVVDASSRFREKIAKMYEAASKEDYALAIDYANEATKEKVPDSEKVIAYYTKGVALMLMNYHREALDYVNSVIDKCPNDFSMNILKCEILAHMKDKGGLISSLQFFNSRPLDEVMPFDRILSLYLQFRLFDEGLEFIKPRMKYFSDSYTLNTYLGMLYFNIGEIKKAKSIFSNLNGLYGDLCDARHLINYINYGIERPMLVSPYVGNIVELTTQYTNEMCMYLEQEDVSAVTYATMDIGNFVAKIKWLAINNAIDIAIAAIEKLYIVDTSKLSDKTLTKLGILKMEISKLLVCVEELPVSVRECIAHYQILSEHNVTVVSNGYFYIEDPDTAISFLDVPQCVQRAFLRAFAFAIVRSKELYDEVMKFAVNLNAIYFERNLNWRSEYAVFAVILYYAFGRKDVTDMLQGFKFNRQLYKKYIQDLTGEELD